MTITTRSGAKFAGAAAASEAQPGSKHKTAEGAGSPSPKRSKKDENEHETVDETLATNNKTQKPSGKRKTHAPKDKRPPPKARKEEPKGRESRAASESVPSSILEKGIIYFFFRGRVNVDDPSSIDDIARSFLILRPLAHDAKLGRGPIRDDDAGTIRLCVIPKKVLPQSGRDRWIAFVDKSGASFPQLKDEFLASSAYETKTAGTRHRPAATPVAEGVYAITNTGRESHLVYLVTLPRELGEVQRAMGLRERGSFIISTKNPRFPGPAGARLPEGPEYPADVLEEFGSRRWVPTQPKHLDFVNTQFLLVGQSSGVEKALRPQESDQKEGRAEPADELEKLEDEDVQRMKELGEDDSGRIFADLQVRAEDYPKLETTF